MEIPRWIANFCKRLRKRRTAGAVGTGGFQRFQRHPRLSVYSSLRKNWSRQGFGEPESAWPRGTRMPASGAGAENAKPLGLRRLTILLLFRARPPVVARRQSRVSLGFSPAARPKHPRGRPAILPRWKTFLFTLQCGEAESLPLFRAESYRVLKR